MNSINATSCRSSKDRAVRRLVKSGKANPSRLRDEVDFHLGLEAGNFWGIQKCCMGEAISSSRVAPIIFGLEKCNLECPRRTNSFALFFSQHSYACSILFRHSILCDRGRTGLFIVPSSGT